MTRRFVFFRSSATSPTPVTRNSWSTICWHWRKSSLTSNERNGWTSWRTVKFTHWPVTWWAATDRVPKVTGKFITPRTLAIYSFVADFQPSTQFLSQRKTVVRRKKKKKKREWKAAVNSCSCTKLFDAEPSTFTLLTLSENRIYISAGERES